MNTYQKTARTDRNRRDADRNNNPFSNEKNWIGGDIPREAPMTTPSAGQVSFDRTKTEWIQKKEQPRSDPKPQGETRITLLGNQTSTSRGLTVGNKSPVELMQDILKGARQGEQVRSYYSRQAEQSLSQLLTNKFKLSSYIKRLEGEMVGLDSRVVKNYELLVLLLQQVSGSDVEVRQGDAGMEIKFNRGIIQRQQAEIERLEREKEQRQKQMKYVIEEYESIIFNFNDVIEKLVNREEGRHKSKF